jgi:RHS repeat-associated protein
VWNASNTKVAEYKYDPYGYEVASSGSLTQPLRWKGREYDAETGLIYMRARYYDPTVGRFISEDPIGLAGGINPYTFADGEPVNRGDPSGMECLEWGGFRAVEVSPGHTVYYAKCTNYQLEAITSTAYAPIGFTSGRGAPVAGGGGSTPIGIGGGSGSTGSAAPLVKQFGMCARSALVLSASAVLDAGTLISGVGLVRASVNFFGTTLGHSLTIALGGVGEKAAGVAAQSAARGAVGAAGGLVRNVAYGIPSGMAIGAVQQPMWRNILMSAIPFTGYSQKYEAVNTDCADVSAFVVGR